MSLPCEIADVQDALSCIINERGGDVIFVNKSESNLKRDKYNSIIGQTTKTNVDFKAFPIVYSPSKYTLRKLGFQEKTDLVIHLAYKDIVDNSLDDDSFDPLRDRFIVAGKTYVIQDKTKKIIAENSYLKIIFGLVFEK